MRAAWGILAATLLYAGAARADDAVRAAVAMEEANEALERHDYPTALRRYNDAQKLSPRASGPWLGLGLSYAASGRCPEAIATLEEYLLRRRNAPKPEAQVALDGCRAKVRATGRLRVDSEPSGAEVRLDREDGSSLGATPTELTGLPLGPHRVYLRQPGRTPVDAEVLVEDGVLARVQLQLPPGPSVTVIPVPVGPGDESGRALGGALVDDDRTEAARLVLRAPMAANIYLNNERVSSKGQIDLMLPPGIYGVRVEQKDCRGAEGAVTLSDGEARSYAAEVRPLQSNTWAVVGGLFTVLAAGAEATAIAGHVLADRSVRGTAEFDSWSRTEIYGQVSAGVTAAAAFAFYLVHGLRNRGKVGEGAPYALVPVEGASGGKP